MLITTPLHTDRLLLRPLKATDAAGIFALRSDPTINRYLDRVPQTAPEQAAAFVEKISASTAEGKSCYWAITEKGKDELIGTACIWNLSADGSTAELGYELRPAWQGKGIMAEAIQRIIDYAFQEAGLTILEACTHLDNQASSQLLLKQGFVLHPDRKDPESENLIVFSLSRK